MRAPSRTTTMTLGILAVCVAVAGTLVQLVAMTLNGMSTVEFEERAGNLLLIILPAFTLALTLALAGLLLAEPARRARNPRWWGVAVLGILGLVPSVLDLVAGTRNSGPDFLRFLHLAGHGALVAGGLLLARERAVTPTPLALALAAAYLLALVAQETLGRTAGFQDFSDVYMHNLRAALVPVLAVGFLWVVARAQVSAPDELRSMAATVAGMGIAFSVGAMAVLLAGDASTTPVRLQTSLVTIFALGHGATFAGLAALALAASLRAWTPQPAEVPPAEGAAPG